MLSSKAIEFIHESNRIDWNTINPDTLTMDTVERAAKGDPDTPQEIRDHCLAFERVVEIATNIGTPMIPHVGPLACELHGILTKNILAPQESGQYRRWSVFIGNEVAPRWFMLPAYMSRLQEWFNSACVHPSYALTFHNEFECIHPFSDGNGRTGRLLYVFAMLRGTTDFKVIRYDARRDYYGVIRRYRAHAFQVLPEREPDQLELQRERSSGPF